MNAYEQQQVDAAVRSNAICGIEGQAIQDIHRIMKSFESALVAKDLVALTAARDALSAACDDVKSHVAALEAHL